jgi:hypothetical protein
MNRHTRTCALATTMAAALCLAVPSSVRAQVAGENVNMVTGTGWPGGDPFLQRQNEPSIAVSSANPQHLLAGANDYRTVDIPSPNAGPKMAGDAWLGVFKSLDGGQTWKSYLLPGFPQERLINPGAQGAVCGVIPATKTTKAVNVPCTSGADPVVRAGPDGMFYFGGIMFNRDSIPAAAKGNFGKVFLTRFIDLNDKENGDVSAGPVLGVDPIRYVDVKEVALGGPNDFVDKPWIAVDVPRTTTQTCTVVTPAGTAKTFFAHTVYVAYLRILSTTQSDVMVRHSDDCGKTWAAPVKVSDATSVANEGPSLAIDPVKGHVYVTWRRVGGLNAGQTDAIMLSRTFSRGARFTKPRVVAGVTPFDQGTKPTLAAPTSASFRVTLFPSSAISVDTAGVRRLHVAWSERAGGSSAGYARVMVATKRLSAPPVTEYEPDENDSTCQKLDAPRAADNRPVAADGLPLTFPGNANVEFSAGHQFMPSITFSQGKLMLVYYDSRLDHTRAYYTPHTVACTDIGNGQCQVQPAGEICPSDGSGRCWTLNADMSFYDVVRGPWGAPVVDADGFNGLETRTDPFGLIFSDSIVDDAATGKVRHSVEVRVASAFPADTFDFTSAPLSKFPFGTRGDEGFLAPRNNGSVHLPGFAPAFPGDEANYDPTAVSLVETDLTTGKLTLQKLQQLKLNPPNLPLFRGGSTPFLGDYIDIQGPAFVKKNGKWAFNTDPTTSPVFHAVWTTNEDVRPPPDANWSAYKPIFVPATSTGSTTSLWDQSTSRASFNCDGNVPTDYLYASSRNQNIYTARVTEGLVVSSPQNSKPLDRTIVRSFVVAATNTTGKPMTATFSFAFTAPLPQVASAGFATTGTGQPDTAIRTVTAVIAPHSTVSRSLFVLASIPTAPLTVTVTETGGGSGFALLNPPGLVPGTVAPPDNCTGSCTGIAAGEQFASLQIAANLSNANLSNANLSNANLSNANLSNANLSNANLSNANLSNANLSNAALANLSNANLSNANLSNANLSNANLSNANLSNANLSNANLSNAAVSDLNYEVQNTGNTSTAYAIKIVGTNDPANPLPPIQLIVAKTYTTPTAVGCAIKEEPHNHILTSINDVSGAVVDPKTLVDPGATNGAVTNATLTLAPGEKAQIVLRARVSLTRMAAIGQTIAPAVVPQAIPPGGSDGQTKYASYSPSFSGAWTVTSVDYTPAPNNPLGGTFSIQVWNDSGYIPTGGTVTLVGDGNVFLGTTSIDPNNGLATMAPSGLLPGMIVTAFYSGTPGFTPSSGTVAIPGWRARAPSGWYRANMGTAEEGSQIFSISGWDYQESSNVSRSVEVYDIPTDTWTTKPLITFYAMPSGPVRSVMANGFLYLVYATRAQTPDLSWISKVIVEERDPVTLDQTATSPWGVDTAWLSTVQGAVVNPGGKLIVFGNNDPWQTVTHSSEVVLFDLTAKTFTLDVGVPASPGSSMSGLTKFATAIYGWRAYVIGGIESLSETGTTNVWEYDTLLTSGPSRWRQVAPMPVGHGRFYLGATTSQGRIYAVGGTHMNSNAPLTTVDAFVPPYYAPDVGTWTTLDPMSVPRLEPGVVASPSNRRIYVIGGSYLDASSGFWTALNAVEEYTP